MTILSRLLNTDVRIRRIQQSITDSGESENDLITVAWGVAARVTRNRQQESLNVSETGVNVASTHKIFTNIGINVAVGDYIYNIDNIYVVSYVDKRPGGKSDSHYEIYANVLGAESQLSYSIVS